MDIGNVHTVDIEEQMREAYLDYAMSVIVARALPDVRDGLKPVHRRILYAMHDMGLTPDKPYRKSARIVGEVLGKYHPHGDSAVYDAMARMAQDFSMRYPLVDGQGNFGSIDGDSPAAMRYTEARLAPLAMEMLQDIEKDTVDWWPNFDGSLQEPMVLPAKLPQLLLNGSAGIAVGMATNIPPHNLREVADAIAFVIDHYEAIDELGVEDLMQFIPGPDFPTGGLILGTEGIRNAYATGRGTITVRAVTQIQEMKGGRYRIVISEIPYQLNKTTLLERIAELVRSGRLDGISDLRDESDRSGMQIIVELKRGTPPRKLLNQLFKYTPLQTSYGINMLALVDGEPRVLSLKRALQCYVEHRREVVRRRTEHDLKKARARAHILEGLRIALDHLDEVIRIIRQSPDAPTAQERLMRRFGLSEVQAQAILDMPLRRLARLERQQIEEEYARLLETIQGLEAILADPHRILQIIKDEALELKEKYGDPRRTRIVPEGPEEFSEEDLVPHEDILIAITQRNYVKRWAAESRRPQGRGGRGTTALTTREEDAVQYLFLADTLDYILYFTNRGRVFQERAFQIPDASRQSKGIALAGLINLDPEERVTAAVPVPPELLDEVGDEDGSEEWYLVMATRLGRIKRTPLREFASIRPSGLIALDLAEGDELGWVRLTDGRQEVVLVTEKGQAIRFPEEEVRPMGRVAAGVMAIRLDEDDAVISMEVVEPEHDLLVVTRLGYGKRTPMREYPVQSRYGKGVRTLTSNLKKAGRIAAARIVAEDDEVTVISEEGIVLRTRVAEIPQMGRATRGARVMALREGDRVASLARVPAERPTEGEEA
ncbi:MAG: DNA gyrase subunit A [Anaerolineae bacterium]|nr:DNA gyrase subunit A [Anaerolineae bacterium]